MKIFQFTSALFSLLCVGFSSCSKKVEPDTAWIRNTGNNTGTSSTDSLSDATGDEFSLAGDPLLGFNNDLLAPRDKDLDAFNDPLNTIRPFEPVYFGFDQYNIGADERTKLQDVASYLSNNPGSKILIEGYCDWKGTPAYHKSLGDRRASSVKQYLVDLGSDSSRIEILSMGDELATPNADSTTSALERKAHFVVLGDS